jgi:hypothetical protein
MTTTTTPNVDRMASLVLGLVFRDLTEAQEVAVRERAEGLIEAASGRTEAGYKTNADILLAAVDRLSGPGRPLVGAGEYGDLQAFMKGLDFDGICLLTLQLHALGDFCQMATDHITASLCLRAAIAARKEVLGEAAPEEVGNAREP